MLSARLFSLLIGLQSGLSPSIVYSARTPTLTSSITRLSKQGQQPTNSDSVRCTTAVSKFDDGTDSTLMAAVGDRFRLRWSVAQSGSITVVVSRPQTVAGWTSGDGAQAESALSAWSSGNSPVRFRLVPDSEPAQVIIHWVDHFDAQYTGLTTVTWDGSGRIVAGDVALAMHGRDGAVLSAAQRYEVLLHEIGHVLGLGHDDGAASIMHGTVGVSQVSQTDFRALSELYARPVTGSQAAQDSTGVTNSRRCTVVR